MWIINVDNKFSNVHFQVFNCLWFIVTLQKSKENNPMTHTILVNYSFIKSFLERHFSNKATKTLTHIFGHYNPSAKCGGVLILHMSVESYSLKSTPNSNF